MRQPINTSPEAGLPLTSGFFYLNLKKTLNN